MNCVFCPSPATNKRGEHIFDDWLNKLMPRPKWPHLRFVERGADNRIVRTYPSRLINTTRDVVCDNCNNRWMSDLTNITKTVIEGFVAHERPATLGPLDITTIAAYAFMKAAVVDTYHSRRFISRSTCFRFKDTLVPPTGVQIWLAHVRSGSRIFTQVRSGTVTLTSGAFNGYQFYVFTYVLGHLAIQLTYPRWTKTSKRPPLPVISQDEAAYSFAVPIWPDITTAEWPPVNYLDRRGLQQFRNRFANNMRSARRLPRALTNHK